MLRWLKGRTDRTRGAADLYEGIVAVSRRPALYEGAAVPDTTEGRLEVLLLHVILVLDRLKHEGAGSQRLGQRLLECLVADVDDAMRRSGLGDDSVAGRMPKLAGALAERARDYGQALDAAPSPSPGAPVGSAPGPLEQALLEHVYRPEDSAASAVFIPAALRLGTYVRRARAKLADAPAAGIADAVAALAEIPV
jgi:cytochrome b pre-mRNA-processing protein 3